MMYSKISALAAFLLVACSAAQAQGAVSTNCYDIYAIIRMNPQAQGCLLLDSQDERLSLGIEDAKKEARRESLQGAGKNGSRNPSTPISAANNSTGTPVGLGLASSTPPAESSSTWPSTRRLG
ncbi:hypothetical protein K466DRAFT_570588 [Polyporus arcularius HHB13444]|uniref:Uncharacterized protein n=1 Tax=Polyporus arcularius HHB13444 TaxID=1314778 RepID=A0A5C3NNL9_9APHY|nr:hypothetical protein K466DRAFT_570588 [Polyporus arcularius HHB13444]